MHSVQLSLYIMSQSFIRSQCVIILFSYNLLCEFIVGSLEILKECLVFYTLITGLSHGYQHMFPAFIVNVSVLAAIVRPAIFACSRYVLLCFMM